MAMPSRFNVQAGEGAVANLRKSADPSLLECTIDHVGTAEQSLLPVRVRRLADGLSVARSPILASSSRPAPRIDVELPERFCSIDISCAGGVSVDTVKEASSRLRSRHGNVHLRSAMGEAIAMEAEMGHVNAGKLDGSANLHAGQGDVALQLFTGGEFTARAPNGNLQASAVYCQHGTLVAQGDIHLRALRTECHTAIHSVQGSVSIDSLDGEGETVVTAGDGDISIHLEHSAGRVVARSERGDIFSHLPPDIWRAMTLFVHGRSVASDAERILAKAKEAGASADRESASIVLEAPQGAISLQELSWIGMVEGKLGASFGRSP